MLNAALKNLADGNPSAEVCTCLGEYYEACEEYSEAAMWYYNAKYEAQCQLALRYGHELPLQGLIRCYQALGNSEQADYYRKEL
jgi:hypothetical protein